MPRRLPGLVSVHVTENVAWGLVYGNSQDFLFPWLIASQPHRREHSFMQMNSYCVPAVCNYRAFAGSQFAEEKVVKCKITIKCSKVLCCWQTQNV